MKFPNRVDKKQIKISNVTDPNIYNELSKSYTDELYHQYNFSLYHIEDNKVIYLYIKEINYIYSINKKYDDIYYIINNPNINIDDIYNKLNYINYNKLIILDILNDNIIYKNKNDLYEDNSSINIKIEDDNKDRGLSNPIIYNNLIPDEAVYSLYKSKTPDLYDFLNSISSKINNMINFQITVFNNDKIKLFINNHLSYINIDNEYDDIYLVVPFEEEFVFNIIDSIKFNKIYLIDLYNLEVIEMCHEVL